MDHACRWVRGSGAGFLLFLLAVVGCAGPGPKLFPKAPQSETQRPGGMIDRAFDTNGDGKTDYVERQAPDGMVALLRYDADGDGIFELETLPPALASTDLRHLMIILDSIPFDLVRRVREEGRFRLFHAPSRVISPFPVMTDLSLAEFFGVSPTLGVESQYFDGRRLNTGYGTYARATISTWHDKIDYHLPYSSHGLAYSRPEAWYGHELKHIGRLFAKRGQGCFIGYVVGTSALGAFRGDEGHLVGLVQLDRFCQRIIHRNHGDVHITLLSDHGHADVPSRWLDLRGTLRRFGYRVRDKLHGPRDVVVPAFGIVTCAVIHTKQPERVATDLSGVEGIGLAAYLDDSGEVIVLSGEGRGRISRRDDRFRYQSDHGDPLRLVPIMEELAGRGDVGTDGFVDDRILQGATVNHVFPDVVHRLWRAFHGLISHTPDVLLSIEDGYFCGSSLMNKLIKLRSVHGNLNRASSSGFVMSTAGRVDAVIRMEDLRGALRSLGIPLE